MKEYLVGFVIGPIYETISQSRSVKEHWLASFLFSEISKELIGEVLELPNTKLYSPIVTMENIKKAEKDKKDNLGKYPDQIIFKTAFENEAELDAKIKEIIQKVKNAKDEEYIIDKLQSEYFKIDYAALEYNGVNDLENLLAILTIADNSLSNYQLKDRLFINDYFDNDINNRYDLFKTLSKVEDDNLDSIQQISKYSNFPENYLLVYYDGNSVGANLKEKYSQSEEEYINASKKLTEFSDYISEEIDFKKYRALPLYIAGDDGFLIMPISNIHDGEQVYYQELLEEINDVYSTVFTDEREVGMTLRFSVVMAETDIPFKRAYKQVTDGLYECKSLGLMLDPSSKMNNVLFQIVRKGTQTYKMVYPLGMEPIWVKNNLLKDRNKFNLQNDFLPNSVYTRMDKYSYVFEDISSHEGEELRTQAFIANILELSANAKENYENIISSVQERRLIVLEEKFDTEKKQVIESNVYNLGKIMNYIDKVKANPTMNMEEK